VRPEELSQWKIPMRLPGKVAAAFRLAAQCPSQLHHRVPDLSINVKEPPPPPQKKKKFYLK